jgi:micrococcal nuclease
MPTPLKKVLFEKARVEKIVDGDTVDVCVDLGFFVKVVIRIRLAFINAPEANLPEGQASKRELTALCSEAEVRLNCHGRDKYGRWVGEISRKTDGLDINAEMVRLGFAEKYLK